MALAGGLQYIDNLALRFSLHGLEDSFAGKPTFCFSWSEPFDLDTVAGRLATNPKRSRSFPITKRITDTTEKQNVEKLDHKKEQVKTPFRVHSPQEDLRPQTTTKQLSDSSTRYTYANVEDESSDEELCDIMAEQENIKFTQDFAVKMRFDQDARDLENCEKKKTSCRKRYLEELDTYTSGRETKRPRPRLDFDKVLLSRTKYSEEENKVSKKVGISYFAPIVKSDSED